jgi:hypothetical protein
VAISVSGTAAPDEDFTLLTPALFFSAGIDTATARVAVIDDQQCERTPETIALSLHSPTNLLVGAASTQTITIAPSDSAACFASILLVRRDIGGPQAALYAEFDKRLHDSLAARGHTVAEVSEDSLQLSPHTYLAAADVVLMSPSLRRDRTSDLLRDSAVGLVCGQDQSSEWLGLVSADSTGSSSATSLTVSSGGIFSLLYSTDTTIAILPAAADIPWAGVSAGTVTEATVAAEPSHSVVHTAEQGVQLPGGYNAPGRRAGFYMVNITSAVPEYTSAWYDLLEATLLWAAGK